MKLTLLIALIGLSLSYNAGKAVTYALKHCKSYNKNYNTYPGLDCANFVSQCLIAGGQSLFGCSGVDKKGAIPSVDKLKSCLSKKGWKSSFTKPSSFKPGYPIFHISYSHGMIATKISGSKVYYASHSNDRCGDDYKTNGIIFYYR